MERNIKISVVIPVYNTADYIEECLDSLYIQEYKDIEYILIDDGSTDNSLEVCQKYADKDERFVVIHKENGGPSSARNLAMSVAKGEYITFADSDDSLVDNAYTIIDSLLRKHNNPDMLIFGANLFPNNAPKYLCDLVTTRDIVYEQFTPELLYNEVGARPFLWLQVIKRSIITDNNMTMDEEMNLGEDQLFQIMTIPFAKKVVFSAQKLYNYRWNRTNSLMNNYNEQLVKKLLVHVRLVEKVFENIFTERYSDKMHQATFSWSVFFIWGDAMSLLEENQTLVCSKLVDVWEKYDYKKYYGNMTVWGRLRVDQIVLLGELDRTERIKNLEEANAKLKKEIEELKMLPECKNIFVEDENKIKKHSRKFFATVKNEGFFAAIKKAIKKILKKLLK